MPIDRVRKNRWPLYLLFAASGVVVLCLAFVDICPLIKAVWPSLVINKTAVIDFLRSFGAWSPLGSIGLMIIHSFIPFPAEFLAIANGMVFGPFWGVVVTWVGAMLGAYASFGLTRLYGRPFVARKVSSSQLEKLDRWVKESGTVPLLVSRFIPVISFNLINYGAGMTRISWWTFTWTTGIGILPITVIMVLMGNRFSILPWWAWLVLLLAIVGTAYLVKFMRISHRKE